MVRKGWTTCSRAAGHETEEGEDDNDRQGPLNFRCEIAEPKNAKGDDGRGHDRAQGQPGQPIFVRQSMPNFRRGVHEIARSISRAVPSSRSQPIMLQASVKRASTQAESLGRFARVPVSARQRFLDQKSFHFLQAHLFEPSGVIASTR